MKAWFKPRVRAQVIKELLSLLRDPKNRFILVVPPLMQLLVFSFAATLEVRNVDLAVFNRDAGRFGHEVIQRLSHSYFVHDIITATDTQTMEKLLDEGQVIGTLTIPDDFSRALNQGSQGRIQVVLDGRKANAAQITLSYLQQVVLAFNQDFGLITQSQNARIELRNRYNANLTYRWFIVPSLGGTLVMFVTLMVSSLSIARERELGTFDQLLVSPCTAAEIIFAKIVPAVLMGLLLGIIMLFAGVFLFGAPFLGSLPLLLICMLTFILSVVGIGLMISSVCQTQQQAILGTFSIGVPAVLMSGFATPVENMPRFLQWCAEFIPLKHYLILVQGSFMKALPLGVMVQHAYPLLLIALGTLSISVFFVRRTLQ
jgi:ABC-2 type transport system permease protein